MTSESEKLKNAWVNPAEVSPPTPDTSDEPDLSIDEYMAEEWEAELENIDMGPPVKNLPPPERLSIFQRKSKPRHALITFITIIVLFSVIAITVFQLPGMAKSKLEAKLQAAGFPMSQIGALKLGPSYISAQEIKLDQFGFDEIKSLKADVNWLQFFASGDIKNLSLNTIHLGRDASNVGADARRLIDNLLILPDYRISVSDVTVDVTTDFGELRITMDGSVTPDESGTQKLIKARIQSSQFQLGFDSTWNGTLSESGGLDLSAEVADGRFNVGPMRISRYNGWVGLSLNSSDFTISSQMEAGSATFMDVPLQNLSLVSAYESGTTNVLLRSGLSGLPDVMFSADMFRNGKDEIFTAILSGNNLGMLLDYIEEVTSRPKEIRPELVDFGPFRFSMNFEADKRFVGGPLPFAIDLSSNGQQVMGGNILAYPDTLDVRGSLETNDALAIALQDYFKIPSEYMRQNFIRLDGDMRRFFAFGEPPAAATNP